MPFTKTDNPHLPRVKHIACGKNEVCVISDMMRCLYCNSVIHNRDEIVVEPAAKVPNHP